MSTSELREVNTLRHECVVTEARAVIKDLPEDLQTPLSGFVDTLDTMFESLEQLKKVWAEEAAAASLIAQYQRFDFEARQRESVGTG